MRTSLILATSLLIAFFSIGAVAQTSAKKEQKEPNETRRAGAAATVFSEIINAPDKRIPESVLQDTDCIAVFPDVLNAAFIFGGRYGKGLISCRTGNDWSKPVFMKMKGGSLGWQIGGQSTDYVLLFMTENSIRSLLTSKFTVGTEASVAAGPVGRTAAASTDTRIKSQILSYSRTKGAFAGLALNGVSIAPDSKANKNVYGKKAELEQLLKQASSDSLAVGVYPESLKSLAKKPEAKKDGRE